VPVAINLVVFSVKLLSQLLVRVVPYMVHVLELRVLVHAKSTSCGMALPRRATPISLQSPIFICRLFKLVNRV
jgi:hypothetical protein